jgi:hypothetical protein
VLSTNYSFSHFFLLFKKKSKRYVASFVFLLDLRREDACMLFGSSVSLSKKENESRSRRDRFGSLPPPVEVEKKKKNRGERRNEKQLTLFEKKETGTLRVQRRSLSNPRVFFSLLPSGAAAVSFLLFFLIPSKPPPETEDGPRSSGICAVGGEERRP